MAVKLTLFAILLLLGLIGLTQWRAALHEGRAETSHPPQGRIILVDGHRVHGIVLGQGPDLVLIHGSSGSTREFSFSLAGKLAQDFRVTILDRPGLGYSDRINSTGATLTQQAAILSKAAQQLGAKKPIVLGQSYGGAVALAWAIHQPKQISALVLVSGASHPWDTPLETYYKITSHPWIGPLVIPLITAFVPNQTVSDTIREIFEPNAQPAGYDAYIGTGLPLRRQSVRANAMQRRNLLAEIKIQQPHYKDIKLPTEIIHGEADDIVPAWNHSERLVAEIEGARLTLLPGIGHMPHQVAEDDVIAAVHRAAARAGLH